MRIAVPRETVPGETRVALTPDAAGRLTGEGHEVVLERDAGRRATFPDRAYRDAGAGIAAEPEELLAGADAVLKVGPPRRRNDAGPHEADLLPAGSLLAGFLRPHAEGETLRRLAGAGVTALAIELMPRITRAQRMDALSSMSTVAGYRATLLAAGSLPRFFPMLMTAAGTISPARVLVLGAGVAGLQAIATSRRLGAVVEAFDIRPEVKEQVESLGATFVEWEGEEEASAEGGYAAEVSGETEERERELIARHVADADVVITTALVPGRPAPVLVTADMVEAMRPGSVILDLAAEAGGNCELTEPGEAVDRSGVTVHGPENLPASLPYHASRMYAQNLSALLEHLAPEGTLRIDLEDRITAACCVTHGGEVRYEGPGT